MVLTSACSKNSDNGDSEIVQSKDDGYLLVWNDEFDGNEIYTDNWEYVVNANGGGNYELHYLTAHEENFTSYNVSRNDTSTRFVLQQKPFSYKVALKFV